MAVFIRGLSSLLCQNSCLAAAAAAAALLNCGQDVAFIVFSISISMLKSFPTATSDAIISGETDETVIAHIRILLKPCCDFCAE